MTRIAFTADLHVDTYGSRIDPATGLNARLVDYLRTTRWVAEEASRQGCEALVVAGDFTERRHVNDWLIRHIQDALSGGPARQIFLRGNHDTEVAREGVVTVLGEMGRDWSGYATPGIAMVGDVAIALIPFLDRHWLRSYTAAAYTETRDDGTEIEHAAVDFSQVPDAEIYRILAEQFLTIARGLYAQAQTAGAAATVLVCHQTLAGGHMSERQQAFLGDLSLVVDARALQAIGFEAVVAGHLHRHQVVLPGEVRTTEEMRQRLDGPVLYTGSIERVDFGEERETKGFIVADVGPNRFDWEFVETPARRFVTLDEGELGAMSVMADADDRPLEGAIVRILDVEYDTVQARLTAERLGAFEVMEVSRRPVVAPEGIGGMAEDLTAEQALDEYFVDEPDRERLVERGREILAEVA